MKTTKLIYPDKALFDAFNQECLRLSFLSKKRIGSSPAICLLIEQFMALSPDEREKLIKTSKFIDDGK